MSKEYLEKYTNAQLTELIRSAMSEGCIKPCHVYDAVDILLDRLADKPPRNCDIGTAEEQNLRHSEWCHKHSIDGDMDVNCASPDMHCHLCFAKWAQMPYEEGGADGDGK